MLLVHVAFSTPVTYLILVFGVRFHSVLRPLESSALSTSSLQAKVTRTSLWVMRTSLWLLQTAKE